jgi:uncharacterized membrane protein
MEPKRSKYDTNPLEKDFVDSVTGSVEGEESGGQTERVFGGPTLEIYHPATDSVRAYSESEAPTRHIGDQVTSYPSVFVPPNPRPAPTYEAPRIPAADIYRPPPALYQSPGLQAFEKSGRNNVAGLGIQERWAVMLPYLPFWMLAIVASAIELLLVPRSESRVRFHAAQGIALQIVIGAISTLLVLAGMIARSWSGTGLFKTASVIFLIVAMVRVWKGKSFVIPLLDEPAKWLDEKIKPRK